MFESIKGLTIKQKSVMNIFMLLVKIKNSLLPIYLTKHVQYIREVQLYSFRNMPNFFLIDASKDFECVTNGTNIKRVKIFIIESVEFNAYMKFNIFCKKL